MPFQTQLSPMRWSTSWHRCRSPSTSTVGASPKKTSPGNSQLPWFTIMTLFHDIHLRDNMGDFWNLLSVNSDLEGMEFISTLEAKDFPFYATQVKRCFQINFFNISKIFQIYLLNISKIFVKYFPVPPRKEHVRMGSPAPKHPPLQEIKHNDLINNAINHIIIMDTKNNIKYQEHDNDLILNSSPSEPNSGRRQVCPCTWWSISLRLLDKVPISFLQGHIWFLMNT